MAKYLSNRVRNFNIGVSSITESDTVLNVIGNTVFTGKVTIPDNNKFVAGDGDDLQIYHDGTDSRIENSTGDVKFKNTGSYYFFDEDGGETIASFINDGEVNLYHDGNKKFETTSTGATVTGTALATALSTGASGTGINISTSTITGPATLTIDPAAVGDNTGTVVIAGDLQIDGTTTTVNSTTMTVDDKNLELGTGAANDAAADGGGITIVSGDGNKTFNFEATGDNLGSSENLNLASGKAYKINNTSVLNSTTLGSGVTGSSLTSVGILSSLTSEGTIKFQTTASSAGQTAFLVQDGGASPTDVFRIYENGETVIRNTAYFGPSGSQSTISPNGSSIFLGDMSIRDGSTTNIFLENNGDATFKGDITIADKIIHDGDTNTAIRFPAADTVAVETAGTERLRITDTGLIGIGTDNPVRILDVKSAGSSVIADFECTSQNFTSVDLTNTSGSSRITSLNNDFIISPAGTERLRVASAGQLGLGGANYGTSGQVITSNGSSSAPTWQDISSTTITVADESTDTTCFPLFATDATGSISPKTGSNLTFNSSNGTLTATTFSGNLPTTDLTGSITNAQLAGSITNAKLVNDSVSFGGISLDLGQSDATPAFDLSDATNYPTSSLTGTITNAQLAGSITNAKLVNDSVSFGGVSVDLGASDATPAFDLSDATNYPTSSLSGTITNAQLAGSIANNKLVNDSVSYGGISLDLGASDATPAFDLSDATNYPTSSLSGTITNAQLAGSIANNKLVNDSVSYGGVSLDLGQSDATPAFDLSDATNYPTSSLSGTITNAQLAGSITNAKLVNSSITVSDGSNSTATALGGTITFSGTNNEVDVAESSGTVTIGLPNNVTIANNLTVTGNLQVDGDTVTVNTSTLTVEDKNIEIAKGAANDAAADGAGITVDSGDGVKTWNWVDSTDSWTSSEHINLASGKGIKLNGTTVLSGTTLGSTIVSSSLTSVGTLGSLTVSGNITANGNIVGDNSTNITGIDGITASTFSGSGANLTSLNASNLGSGTIPDARFPATLPAVSGANLTSLNASNLGSGTIPDARFPATLPAVSGANLTALTGASAATYGDGSNVAQIVVDSNGRITGITEVSITGGGSAITVQDEGVSLSTAATTLNFVGSGVVASGTGATKTITISGEGVTSVAATDESSDTTCFPLFATSATGSVAAKTDASGLKYDSANERLETTDVAVKGAVRCENSASTERFEILYNETTDSLDFTYSAS